MLTFAEIANMVAGVLAGCRPRRPVLVIALAMAAGVLCLPPAMVAAEAPRVEFDAGHAVACREVAAGELAQAGPGEKLIKAQFRLSVLVKQGEAREIDDLLIVITSPERRLRVVDFSPKTRLVAEIEGPIETVKTNDVTKSLDARVGGKVGARQGVVDAEVIPSAGGGVTEGSSLKETYKKRAPKILAVASGTTNSEHGVFFKLKRNSQSTLEGVKEFSCLFAVPPDWRADWVLISCLARSQRNELFGKRVRPCGDARLFVGLYMEGDAEGKRLAENLLLAPSSSEGRSAVDQAETAGQSTWWRRTQADPLTAINESLREMEEWICCKDPADVGRPQLREALNRLARLSGKRD